MENRLLEMINASLDEETKDVDKYLTMAKYAEENNHHSCAGVLRDIAKDEQTHIEALKHVKRLIK